ncbi:TetR/AcrR family transcriptional regulator [Streptomyces sp. NPDC048297]|uniref:TetR/AcrR family transcriptional regulator n=1 Tax=Streptomyces sp. NPDC048297 TaxID=3365531 RepID=UPI00371889AE
MLSAAREAFRESGTAAPLDDIARRAGVNIATLYRRFPDRNTLIREVVLDGFHFVLAAARTARDTPLDPLTAVEAMLLHFVDNRELLVLPLIGGPSFEDDQIVEVQRRIAEALEDVLAAGRRRGVVREDINAVDLITTGALACRPLPHLPAEDATALAVRHVRIFVDGLRPAAAHPLPPAVAHDRITRPST